jgi:pimeloyl-ACP methyl ester carboxylesterase
VRERYLQILDRWPVPSERVTVRTREGETFVLVCGSKEAPPLLLFHGSGANAAMWMGDVVEWSKHFRCYAVDMIGEPGLSAPARPDLASDAYALWLDDVLAGLGLQRAAIVGISLGGWLALDYATRRPERVEKLALLCPGGVGRQRGIVLFALPLALFGAWGRRRLRDLVLGREARGMNSPQTMWMAEFASLIFANFRPRRDRLPVFSDAKLRTLSMPLLAILGGEDTLLDSRDTQRRLARNVPHADIRFLPKVGHLIRGQTATIGEFLSRDGQNGRDFFPPLSACAGP